MKMPRLFVVSALLAAAITQACGGGTAGGEPSGVKPPVAEPGVLEVNLTTPNTNDGALLVTITGGPVSSVSPTTYELSPGASTSSGARFLVRGALASGAIARIQVPDVTKATSYAGSVDQAAARTTYLQQSLVGYTMTVARPR